MVKPNKANKKKNNKNPPQNNRPSAVQNNQKQTEQEEGIEESGVEGAGDADLKDAVGAEGNGQGAGETGGGDETNGDERKEEDKTKEGGEKKEGGEETRTTDAHHKVPTGGGETKEGGEPKESGEETQTIDAHHETPTGDQNSGSPGEGGDGETVVDGSNETEPKAAGVDEGKGNEESKANDNGVGIGDKDELSKPNDAGAVEVAGLAELIEVIKAMGSGAAEQPGVAAGLVDRLKNTPLYPAYEALQESWKKMLARGLEMKARQVALPPSPPPTPQTLSTITTKGPHHQDQLPSHPPSKLFKDQHVETDPLPPPTSTQAPLLPPQTVSTDSTQGPEDQLKQPSQSPSKAFKEQGTGTDPLPPKSTQDPKRRLKKLSQSPSKAYKEQQVGTDPLPPKSTQEPKHQPRQLPHLPIKVFRDQGSGPDPLPPASPAPTTQAVPPLDRKELKSLGATITSLSSKIDSMSQAMSKMAGKEEATKNMGAWDNKLAQVGSQTVEQVKSSAGTTNTHIDKVDRTVAQLTTKLDASVSGLQQSIRQLNDNLAKRPTNVASAPAPVPTPTPTPTQAPRLEPKPDSKAGELQAQVKRLRQDLDSMRTELLQADIAFKVALEGIFTAEAESVASGTDAASGRDTLEIARGIRTSTLRLVTRCKLLFSLIASSRSPSGTNLAILEGEWAKCVEHLQARDFRERKAVKDKDEAVRQLQFFRFLVDQIQRGFYTPSEWKLALNGQEYATFMEQPYDGFASIRLLAQEMYRLQHSRSRPRKASTSSKPMHDETRNIPPSGWALLST